MKKVLLGLMTVATIALAGCKNKYVLVITKQGEISGITETEPEIIRAETDSIAYIEALDAFEIQKMVAMNMQESIEAKYISFPIGFTLENSKGELIELPHLRSGISQYDREDEKKAFAGSEFGMSIEQVKQLSPFNSSDWQQRDNVELLSMVDGVIYNDILACENYALGDETYTISLYFNSNGLYRITFTSVKYRWNSHYSKGEIPHEVNMEVFNFRDIIKETYDNPTIAYEFPSASRMEAGRISLAYKWEIGVKEIILGIEESYSETFQMYARIEDTQRRKEEKTAQEKEEIQQQIEQEQAIIKNAATQF